MSPSVKALDIAFCALFAAYAENFGLVQQFYDLRIERLSAKNVYFYPWLNVFCRIQINH